MTNNILIIDTETTGLDHKKDKIIEIGAILYNVNHKSIIAQFSSLYPCEENPAYEINKISEYLLKSNTFKMPISILESMLENSDFIIAHNADFDKAFLSLFHPKFTEKKWICTKNHFKWPIAKGTPLNLIHIAANMGVTITCAHRALNDCQLIASCFDNLNDLEERLEDACKERLLYRSLATFDDNKIVKEHGFSWNSAQKIWQKYLTKEESENLPFKVMKIL